MNPSSDAKQLLQLYLRDHDGASSGGVQLIDRVLMANRSTEFEPALAGLDAAIRHDREELGKVLHELQIAPSRIKRAMAQILTTIGRLKLNGRVVSYSPLSRVVECEALAAAVTAKLSLWVALAEVAQLDPRLDSAPLGELRRSASSQLEAIDELHRAAVRAAFAPDRATSGSGDVRLHG